MKDVTLKILNEIYYKTARGDFITLDELETEFAMNGSSLRAYLEDLKLELLVVEHEEGFQVSRQGLHYCRSIWG